MKPAHLIALCSFAGAAALAGCGDDETTTTATSGTTSAGGSSTSTGAGGATSTSTGTGGTTSAGGSGSGGDAGGAGGAGGGSMGASQACQMCVQNLYSTDANCQAAIQACDSDAGCNAWKDCSENCFNRNDTVACYDACDQAFPHDESISGPLLACTCDACGNVCVASCQ